MFTPRRLLMTFIPPLLFWIGACIGMNGRMAADGAAGTFGVRIMAEAIAPLPILKR
jgi:hypothetical protein